MNKIDGVYYMRVTYACARAQSQENNFEEFKIS